jgi:hypothetical protein
LRVRVWQKETSLAHGKPVLDTLLTLQSGVAASHATPLSLRIAASVLTAALLILIALYVWRVSSDLLVALNNYNLGRARYCNHNDCGLFHHDRASGKQACLSPKISEPEFERRCKGGRTGGCSHSIPVRESPRHSATVYRDEYYEAVRTYDTGTDLTRLIKLAFGVFLLLFGILRLADFVKMAFF